MHTIINLDTIFVKYYNISDIIFLFFRKRALLGNIYCVLLTSFSEQNIVV